MTLVLLICINFFAAFIQGATGLGYGIFAMFFMPLLLPFQHCLVISAVVIVFIGIQMTITMRKSLLIHQTIVPASFLIPSAAFGVYIIGKLDEVMAAKCMGVFLMIISVYFYWSKKKKIYIKERFRNGATVGMLSGLTTGMFNSAGPFMTMYYYDNCENHLQFKANSEFSFLIGGLFVLALNSYVVRPDITMITYAICSGIAALIGGRVGLIIFRKLDKEILKKIITSIFPIMGIILLMK